MTEPYRRETVPCASPSGWRRMAYLEWGDPDNSRVLICVHGLTRCARDFDALARELSGHYRVVCPDVAGRGDSDRLRNPMEYAVPTYANDMVALIARLDVEAVHWVGTSLGGLIGLALAALPGSPVTRLVLNDVGPVLSAAALERIGTYVGQAPDFPGMDAAEQYVRAVSAGFGPHSDAQWRFLTEHVVRRNPGGGYTVHYDPAIAVPFNAQQPPRDIELWPQYEAIRCATLVIRGEQSDLLTRETAAQMASRGPRAKVVEIPGVGHAPTLMHPGQIAVVRDFLLGA
ncbi:MAG: alpha/beta hydrolase [Betaproteobacteria bacterium RIFCSPLOWO2_02_FULL_64_12]|nr:MAG: alpha/beta hydrolase [Betaproteobacteria bacterium RIFCSPLOWO2_02_FULL_64_12]